MQVLKISLPGSLRLRALVAGVGLALLAGCGAASGPDGINDPFEPTNRKIHAFNRGVDQMFLGPTSKGYGRVIPKPVSRAIGNLADTLDLPGDIANNLLQFRIGDAAQNTLRLGTNVFFGVGGIFDTSTMLGLPGKPTDFGETLHVWGFGEGAYLEVPFSGPSTVRDATGTVVDIVMNPVRLAVPKREAMAATAIKLFSRVGDRDRFSETIESILYDSADSYAQARLLYLQNRRFTLNRGAAATTEDEYIDPYEDPYAE